ncbi:unnamed protein product [Triticum turgidum subsp. durum]|uniref:BRX domain-containing protein n=1 Tax=Triticum turgidum subsp. durum TaxID=4567 RepID=A0A9R0X929_TRITD|nr:unnamed protein product [Triticum turgidum subsp. durum]
MLTCIACSRQLGGGVPPLHEPPEDEDVVDAGVGVGGAATPSTRQAIKALTAQIKDMALKASGAYRHCKPCAGSSAGSSGRHHPYHHRGGSGFRGSDAASGSDRFHYAYRRAAGGGSSGEATPSMSARTDFPAGDEEEEEEEDGMSSGGGGKEDNAKEWVAQVEPGVLITFVSLPQGGNDLKRIRFTAVRCSTNGKRKDGGLKTMTKSWNFTTCRGLTIKVFLSLLLQSLKMRAPRRTAR